MRCDTRTGFGDFQSFNQLVRIIFAERANISMDKFRSAMKRVSAPSSAHTGANQELDAYSC